MNVQNVNRTPPIADLRYRNAWRTRTSLEPYDNKKQEERPCDALCQLKFCQLLHSCTKTH